MMVSTNATRGYIMFELNSDINSHCNTNTGLLDRETTGSNYCSIGLNKRAYGVEGSTRGSYERL